MPASRTRLDDLLKDEKKARLIPAYEQKQLEQRLTTVLLATMTVVRPLAKSLIKIWAGKNYGNRARLKAYTEVSFPRSDTGSGTLRPDGVLVLTTGSRRWMALIEAKARASPIDAEQVEAYVGVARDYGIDAVLTVSNQRTALPDHLPYLYGPPKKRSRNKSQVDVRHGSWASIRTEAALILNSEQEVDDEQRYILEEMVAYFRHPKSGVLPFDRMNQEWPGVADGCRNKRPLSRSEVEATVGAWHQEVRDICLILSRRTHQRVDASLPRKHRLGAEGAKTRLEDDCASLSRSWKLGCDLRIPNAASDISLEGDFIARTIACSMALKAPRDRKSPRARINWLKMQLRHKTENPADVIVRAQWRGRVPDTQTTLAEIIADAGTLVSDGSASLTGFVLILQQELSGQFRSRRKFVSLLEDLVDDFYARVGQHLRAWREPPPKVTSRGETSVNESAVDGDAADA